MTTTPQTSAPQHLPSPRRHRRIRRARPAVAAAGLGAGGVTGARQSPDGGGAPPPRNPRGG
ncbi:hypothetical protein, partial [Streptomyces sp. NPDC004783]|uniref:hypothetical protein n=1 Tax=Streptomyces sp. NPDC004783 TaxID=3154459 RepID=UPI0033AB9CC7